MSDAPITAPEARDQGPGRKYEGWAFTFCKAAFLALLFQRYTLLATSGLATLLRAGSPPGGPRMALLCQAAVGHAVLGGRVRGAVLSALLRAPAMRPRQSALCPAGRRDGGSSIPGRAA